MNVIAQFCSGKDISGEFDTISVQVVDLIIFQYQVSNITLEVDAVARVLACAINFQPVYHDIDQICSHVDAVGTIRRHTLGAANGFGLNGHIAGINIEAGRRVLNRRTVLQQVSYMRHVDVDAAGLADGTREFDHTAGIGGKGRAECVGTPLDDLRIANDRSLRPVRAAPPVMGGVNVGYGSAPIAFIPCFMVRSSFKRNFVPGNLVIMEVHIADRALIVGHYP